MSNYNFNEELCRQLNKGEIAVHYNNGDLEMLRALIWKVFPTRQKLNGIMIYYFKSHWDYNAYDCGHKTDKPTVPLSDFIVKDNKPFEWTDDLALEFSVSPYSTISPLRCGLEQFKASKQRKPLFTTEDGKQIFEMQEYFDVCLVDYSISKCMMKHGDPIEKDKFFPFSTEAAAREYVRLNKPMYSLNDIGDAWEKLCHEAFTYDQLITELEKLKQ